MLRDEQGEEADVSADIEDTGVVRQRDAMLEVTLFLEDFVV
jgi:hypothetical protein